MNSDRMLRRLIHRVPPKWLPLVVLVAVVGAFLLTRIDGGADSLTASPGARPAASEAPSSRPSEPVSTTSGATLRPAPRSSDGPTRVSDLPTVTVAELPAEARRTLVLIARGGPYPYDRDGITFGNRERLLPLHPRGWYREFTVPTPGSSDRGARRIVTGSDGGRFYTEDHYDSFREIVG